MMAASVATSRNSLPVPRPEHFSQSGAPTDPVTRSLLTRFVGAWHLEQCRVEIVFEQGECAIFPSD